jgi:hypothetical protein
LAFAGNVQRRSPARERPDFGGANAMKLDNDT